MPPCVLPTHTSSSGGDGLSGLSAVSPGPPRHRCCHCHREDPTPGLPVSWRIAGRGERHACATPSLHSYDFRRISTFFHRKLTDRAGHPPYIYLRARVVGYPTRRRALVRHRRGRSSVSVCIVCQRRISGGETHERSRRPSSPPSHTDRYSRRNPPVPGDAAESDPGLHRGSALPGQAGLLECQGKEGSQLQALFEIIATELDAYADLVAERLVVLGGVALGTARTAARQSSCRSIPATSRQVTRMSWLSLSASRTTPRRCGTPLHTPRMSAMRIRRPSTPTSRAGSISACRG